MIKETGSARPDHGKQGSIQIPYPKFDLGKPSRHFIPFDGKLRTAYATIDREGQQTARTFPCRHNAESCMDWRRR